MTIFLQPATPGGKKGPKNIDVNIELGLDGEDGGSGGRGSSRGGSSGGKGPSGGDGPGGSGSDGEGGGDDSTVKGPNIDILFYLSHKDDGRCWDYLSSSIERVGFLSHIGKSNWQVSMAFSVRPKLQEFRRKGDLPLVRNASFFKGDVIFVLKRKDIGGYHGYRSLGEADESLGWSILNEYIRRPHTDVKEPKKRGEMVFPLGRRPVENPLAGLHNLLESEGGDPRNFIRDNAHSFVVLLEFGRYGYTQQNWEDFSRAHQGIQFVAVSSRRNGVVSKRDNLDWIPCGNSEVAKILAEYIVNKVPEY